ncbi:MAG: O-antigen ligase family protein [Flavobacteriales bacterium]|nr:O-antigen ligase family protein [Flavobacteriales bacterium]
MVSLSSVRSSGTNVISVLAFVALWSISGSVNQVLGSVMVLLTFALCVIRERFYFLFIFYVALLILSDSRSNLYDFIKTVKPIVGLIVGFVGIQILVKKRVENPILKNFLPFIIIAMATSLLSLNFVFIQKSVSYALLLIGMPALIQRVIDENRETVFKDIIQFVVVALIIGLMFLVINPEAVFINQRFHGVLGNPNGLGLFIMVTYFLYQVIILNLPQLFSLREKIFIFIIYVISIIRCGSRNTIAALLIFHAFLYLSKKSPALGFSAMIVLIIVFGVIDLNLIAVIQFFNLEEVARVETLREGSGRTIAWDFIWSKIVESNIILGDGIGATQVLFNDNYKQLSILGHQGNAHNSYFTFWYDTGVFGLAAYVFGLIRSFVSNRGTNIIVPIMVSVLFSAYFESWLTASQNPFTIILMAILVTLHYFQNNKENEQTEELKPSQ